ncbi:haloalkane dehalogenase [Conexibacter sp. CPCC 206217]|uniref:haloalkane dehalogenase n=1 Tax=Conexibacter sp. CPCC 206217 TaxID=3064574 RepID=UPI00271DC4C7|nr:haloalkane dehalogenase [Conexibacter sp. CPCC 206217]MDO8211349.1 haloalkane dehalogenase [Conexibacter sp. CPCC 206217]
MSTGTGEVVRTPEERFEALPDFPWRPHHREVGGLRLAHVDEGDGSPIVLLHGEPTWSFLWRHTLRELRAAGHRVIAPDHAGFGRSDKPTALDWYSYDRHTTLTGELLERLDLCDATLVVHDWGGPIGLRLAAEQPHRIGRIVVTDTGLFTGHQKMTAAWEAFRGFVEQTEDLPVGMLVRAACHSDPGDAVIAAYDAPFPDAASKAGARAFPLLIPRTPDEPGAAAGQRTLDALAADTRPLLVMWADSDPVIPLATGEKFAAALGGEVGHVLPQAGHFLQEDQGALLGRLIADWLAA